MDARSENCWRIILNLSVTDYGFATQNDCVLSKHTAMIDLSDVVYNDRILARATLNVWSFF